MLTLKSIILDSDTKAGRLFDIFIQSLIVISLVAFSIETLPDLSDGMYEALSKIEMFVVVVFTIEYALRIILSEKRLSYVFSFYGEC